MSGKKDDPNYAPVRGHVPVELYRKFRIFCLDRNVDNSAGLEILLTEYFDNQDNSEQETAPPAQTKPPSRRRRKSS